MERPELTVETIVPGLRAAAIRLLSGSLTS